MNRSLKKGVLVVGTHVQARYKRGLKWEAGDIINVRDDGTYDVNYLSQEIEERISPTLIRSLEPETPTIFTVGQRVQCLTSRWAYYVNCRIVTVQSSGLIDVIFEDASRDECLDVSQFRLIPDGEGGVCLGGDYSVGQSLEARQPVTRRWQRAKIIRVHDNFSYDICFENGLVERGRFPEDLRPFSPPADATASFYEGQEVEAQYGGRSAWYKGRVLAVHGNGIYDVQFEDGDKQLDLPADLLRPSRAASVASDEKNSPVRNNGFYEGQDVESRYRGEDQWFHAQITRVNKDGSYDVTYDDDEVELAIPSDCLRRISGDRSSSRTSGDDTFLSAGKITAVQTNGTYGQGQSEYDVPGELSKMMDGSSTPAKRSLSPSHTRGASYGDGCPETRYYGSRIRSSRFEEGQKVRPSGKLFEAKITRRNDDNTYNDGKWENNVSPELMWSLEDSFRCNNGSFPEGSKVEVCSKAEARVTKVNRNGTYHDVVYTNGVHKSRLSLFFKDEGKYVHQQIFHVPMPEPEVVVEDFAQGKAWGESFFASMALFLIILVGLLASSLVVAIIILWGHARCGAKALTIIVSQYVSYWLGLLDAGYAALWASRSEAAFICQASIAKGRLWLKSFGSAAVAARRQGMIPRSVPSVPFHDEAIPGHLLLMSMALLRLAAFTVLFVAAVLLVVMVHGFTVESWDHGLAVDLWYWWGQKIDDYSYWILNGVDHTCSLIVPFVVRVYRGAASGINITRRGLGQIYLVCKKLRAHLINIIRALRMCVRICLIATRMVMWVLITISGVAYTLM